MPRRWCSRQEGATIDDTTFKLGEALAAQAALRRSLSLPEELFPVESFAGMISDEIEDSRRAGPDDQAIVDLIRDATGKAVIARFNMPPEARPHPET